MDPICIDKPFNEVMDEVKVSLKELIIYFPLKLADIFALKDQRPASAKIWQFDYFLNKSSIEFACSNFINNLPVTIEKIFNLTPTFISSLPYPLNHLTAALWPIIIRPSFLNPILNLVTYAVLGVGLEKILGCYMAPEMASYTTWLTVASLKTIADIYLIYPFEQSMFSAIKRGINNGKECLNYNKKKSSSEEIYRLFPKFIGNSKGNNQVLNSHADAIKFLLANGLNEYLLHNDKVLKDQITANLKKEHSPLNGSEERVKEDNQDLIEDEKKCLFHRLSNIFDKEVKTYDEIMKFLMEKELPGYLMATNRDEYRPLKDIIAVILKTRCSYFADHETLDENKQFSVMQTDKSFSRFLNNNEAETRQRLDNPTDKNSKGLEYF